jgi:hypothetical protein
LLDCLREAKSLPQWEAKIKTYDDKLLRDRSNYTGDYRKLRALVKVRKNVSAQAQAQVQKQPSQVQEQLQLRYLQRCGHSKND